MWNCTLSNGYAGDNRPTTENYRRVVGNRAELLPRPARRARESRGVEAAADPGLFEDSLEVHLGNVGAAVRVGAALVGRGDHPRAERLLGKCEEFLQGMDEALRRALAPAMLARVYLHQGRHDEALTEWRIAFENGWRKINDLLFISPQFDPVRDDPRFRALVDDAYADFDRQRLALAREGLASAD